MSGAPLSFLSRIFLDEWGKRGENWETCVRYSRLVDNLTQEAVEMC
jgi:hypothetical protein